MAGGLQSVAHAAQLLRLLGQRGPLGVTAIAAALGVGTSTAHRLLSTLVTEQLVARRPNGRAYGLVEGVVIAPVQVELDRILVAAPPIMESLRDVSQETVHIAVLSGYSIVYVASVESHQMMRVTSRVGEKAPAHLSAAGKVLMAHRRDRAQRRLCETQDLERRTPHSIDTGAALRAELERVRENGYARNISESEVGLYALAVPIFGEAGQAVCSLTISGPEVRIAPQDGGALSARELDLLEALHDGAQRLQAVLD